MNSDREAIPRPLLLILVGLSLLLNFAGVASIVEDLVSWFGFFRKIIDLYAAYIRGPIVATVIALWPQGWPIPPRWCYDVLIIWTTSFAGYRLSKLLDREHTVFAGWGDFFGNLIAGPFVIVTLISGLFLVRRIAEIEFHDEMVQ